MRRKLGKYIKFLICMAIIISLVAPSYATLSASDGSAFVTKAEFDSALSDFNARLTTFEAGINSKIDSQVTSYLDRNGIWSGKDQTLEDDFKDKKTYNLCNFGFMKKFWGLNCTDNTLAKGEEYESKKVIDKINKSGLMRMSYTLSASNSTYYFHTYCCEYQEGGWEAFLNFKMFFNCTGNKSISKDNFGYLNCFDWAGTCFGTSTFNGNLTMNDAADAAKISTQWQMCILRMSPLNMGVEFYTFVKKNDPLYLFQYLNNGVSKKKYEKVWVTNSMYSWDENMSIVECTVY